MKTSGEKNHIKITERGQAIILIAFAFIGLVVMVGLVTDTGLLLIEYGKLKRGVDAAAVAAAQEFRPDPVTHVLNVSAMENAARSFLQVNQLSNVRDIEIHTCEDTGADRPELCNPDPEGNPIENRKLVEVSATADVAFGFMRVIGINGTELRITSVGEATTIDLVLLIDTSGSMAYETSGNPTRPDPGDNPITCNTNDNCQPLRAVKDIALEFVDSLIYFGYDRVSVIAMTGQAAGPGDAVMRDPVEVLPLSFDRDMIFYSIDNLKVFQPRICNDPYSPDALGECLEYVGGSYNRPICEAFEYRINYPDPAMQATADPSSCTSSNIGGMLELARESYSGSGNPDIQRPQALWVTVLLASGPANATDVVTGYPNGICPQNTWLWFWMPDPQPQWCRDAYPDNYHPASSALIPYTNPANGETMDVSPYDASDFARDKADSLAAMKTGTGVTIYTIGLGEKVKEQASSEPSSTTGEAEYLLAYIAREAGDTQNPNINHGEYFYAPNNVTLRNIFEIIAQNIATKLSQ